jgi:hypothetical protein
MVHNKEDEVSKTKHQLKKEVQKNELTPWIIARWKPGGKNVVFLCNYCI